MATRDPGAGKSAAPLESSPPERVVKPRQTRTRQPIALRAETLAILGVLSILGAALGQPAGPESVEAQVQAHLEAAELAESEQDYLAAAERYEAILALRPDWALIHQSLGVTLHLAKRFPQSIERLLEAVRLDGQLWGAFLFLGIDYYQVGKFDDAIEALKQSLGLNAEVAETRRWLGLSYGAVQRYEEAVQHLSQSTGPRNDDAEALFHLARAYDSRASQLFEEIGRAEPDSPFVSLLQAERFLANNDLDRAQAEYFRALRLRPGLAGTLPSLGEAASDDGPPRAADGNLGDVRKLFGAGQYLEVAARTRKALASDATNVEARYWQGRSYKNLATATVQRLTEVAPDSYRVDQLAAELHRDETEYEKAVAAYQRALSKSPDLPGLRYAIGDVYWTMRRLDEAEDWLRQELDRNPHHALARHRLGSLLLERGMADDALVHLHQAVEMTPDSAAARFDLGRAYLDNGQHADAVRELKESSRQDPDNDRVHYLLASAYRGLGQMDDARRELTIYQEARQRRLKQVQTDVSSVADDLKQAAP